ncbi:MAG: alpha-hydroxy-acid oxidizing protein [Gemmatimonadetes bacterium]|nr:alpha-hydroxy-acid oxidizing protein [Gemmatimonadota bacterium]
MGSQPFDWIAGGAGEEWTLRANREAFHRWSLRPRILTGNAERDLSIDILGAHVPGPWLLAPIGAQTLAHPDGELAVARAAAAAGVPLIVSQAASFSMEEIAAACGEGSRWYQLYWVNDREVVESLVDRAISSGYRAIVLTVDTPVVGLRDRDERNAYSPFRMGHGIGQYTSDPVFRRGLGMVTEESPRAAADAVARMFPNLSLTWKDISWLRSRTDLPLLIKGILTAEDARRSRDAGFDGIVVSNHGGRQLDGVAASLDALPEVRNALGDDAVVLMDSGIRRGTDVVKALALGADAVLLGRPYIYGLAVGGQAGVEHVLRTMMAEIDHALALVGARSTREVDRTYISPGQGPGPVFASLAGRGPPTN